jgi:hypothetical protein
MGNQGDLVAVFGERECDGRGVELPRYQILDPKESLDAPTP